MQHSWQEPTERTATGQGAARAAGASVRRVADKHGCTWMVRERAGDADHHGGRSSLTFECARAIRRVWTYPSAWRALTDEQLIALSWKC